MSVSVLPESEPATKPRKGNGTNPKPRSRARYNQVMKSVRRTHLYAGLFMTPWVFLYGISALLFNHPELFSDQEIRRFGPEVLNGTALAQRPAPAVLAERVLASLNATASLAADSATPVHYRLIRPEDAGFERELFTSVRGAKLEHTIRLDLESGSGTVRSGNPIETRGGAVVPEAPTAKKAAEGESSRGGPPRGQGEGPGSRRPGPGRGAEGGPVRGPAGASTAPRLVALDPPALPELEPALTEVVRRLGLDAVGPSLVRLAPELTFHAENQGKPVRISYNVRTGLLSERNDDGTGRSLSTRRFLLQLHTAHGYPKKTNARWVWALAVDAMAVSMVGWGFTGLVMWWQMKNVRAVGGVVLLLSAIVAAATAFGMHQMFTA